MILLQKVTLYGFKSQNAKVEVELSQSSVSIIFGENGCGKTTFLKVLHGLLSQDESILIQNNVEKAVISFTSKPDYGIPEHVELEPHSVTISRQPYLFDSSNDDEKYEYNWGEFLESKLYETSSLSMGVERGVSDKSLKVEPRYISEFFRHPRRRAYLNIANVPSLIGLSEELSHYINTINRSSPRQTRREQANLLQLDRKNLELQNIKIESIAELLVHKYRVARVNATQRIQNALFETLSIAVRSEEKSPFLDQIPLDFNDELSENSERIIEALDDGENNQFKSTVIDILKSLDSEESFEKIRKNNILTHLFVNIMEELKLEQLILSSVNILIDTFNQYLINGKQLVVNMHETYIKFGIDKHTIDKLSSGERHVLTFLTLVLFEGGKRDFLIIDEPEISLNLTWQRELIPLFQKLIPNTQIIVASHSPTLCNNQMDYLCGLELDLTGNL